MFNLDDRDTIIKITGNGLGSLTANQNGCKNDTNPIGITKANIYEDGDILPLLQCLDIEADPESEQCVGNEVSTIALISRKFRTLGSPKC
jgi:hypothetical protein